MGTRGGVGLMEVIMCSGVFAVVRVDAQREACRILRFHNLAKGKGQWV